jgi:arginase
MTPALPVALIGVPTDVGAGHRGASMGPEALRVAGLGEALRARGLQVFDRGNLAGPYNPWQPPQDGYRHLDQVVAWNRALMQATTAELEAGNLPVMLGGDHCLAIGSMTCGRPRTAARPRPQAACVVARCARRPQHRDR